MLNYNIMKPKTNKESQLDIIARHVADIHKNMATKDDIKELRLETKKDLLEVETRLLEKMATKDDLHELENKLIEDTGAMTGTEQKHNRSLTQRVSRLEKEVFRI